MRECSSINSWRLLCTELSCSSPVSCLFSIGTAAGDLRQVASDTTSTNYICQCVRRKSSSSLFSFKSTELLQLHIPYCGFHLLNACALYTPYVDVGRYLVLSQVDFLFTLVLSFLFLRRQLVIVRLTCALSHWTHEFSLTSGDAAFLLRNHGYSIDLHLLFPHVSAIKWCSICGQAFEWISKVERNERRFLRIGSQVLLRTQRRSLQGEAVNCKSHAKH